MTVGMIGLIVVPVTIILVILIVVVVLVSGGENKSALERDKGALKLLPKEVKNYKDAKRLMEAFGGFFTQEYHEHMLKLLEAIKPNEYLYFFGTTVVTIEEGDSEFVCGEGAVFISSERIAFQYSKFDECLQEFDECLQSFSEFSLSKIHTVGTNTVGTKHGQLGKISFHTRKELVEFALTSRLEVEAVLNAVRDVLIRAIETNCCETKPSQPLMVLELETEIQTEEKPKPTRRVVECQSCAATMFIYVGEENQCEYCLRFVE
ncbi:MAG: hypothetical protein FWC89_09675 [Defluviitaleaceae bacterium]|nr:hypothetical protein [Defluviitaleaceae bacterium]